MRLGPIPQMPHQDEGAHEMKHAKKLTGPIPTGLFGPCTPGPTASTSGDG
jgi:hypothetical protein